jgi:hypothetical protein
MSGPKEKHVTVSREHSINNSHLVQLCKLGLSLPRRLLSTYMHCQTTATGSQVMYACAYRVPSTSKCSQQFLRSSGEPVATSSFVDCSATFERWLGIAIKDKYKLDRISHQPCKPVEHHLELCALTSVNRFAMQICGLHQPEAYVHPDNNTSTATPICFKPFLSCNVQRAQEAKVKLLTCSLNLSSVNIVPSKGWQCPYYLN